MLGRSASAGLARPNGLPPGHALTRCEHLNGALGIMARLSELTDRSAGDAAVAEFRVLGRQAFLEKYGFAESKSYFAQVDDQLIDSKPLVAAIWAHQHPGRAPLSAADFSGGEAGAGTALRRLVLQL